MNADVAGFSPTWPVELLLLRGRDRDELRRRAAWFRQFLEKGGDFFGGAARLAEEDGGLTLALIATPAEMRQRLEAAEARLADPKRSYVRDVTGMYFEEKPLYEPGSLAFLFPGEGSQYVGMIGDLFESFSIVRECVEHCDQLTEEGGGRSSLRRFLLKNDFDPQAEQEIRRLDNAMYSVLAADLALALLFEFVGVQPHVCAGHSAGELAALYFAGAIDMHGHLPTVVQTMESLEGMGGQDFAMLAVGASRSAMEELLERLISDAPLSACVAMDNCPHQVVIVGPVADILRIEEAVQAQGRVYERLSLARPYHTQLFETSMAPLRELFGNIPFFPARIPIYSCSSGELFPQDIPQLRSLCVEHWRSPVVFVDVIRNMHRDGVRLFVESGPRGNLTAFAADILRKQEAATISPNLPRRHGVTQFLHALGQLAAHGAPVRRDRLYCERLGAQVEESANPQASGAPAESNEVVTAHWRLMERFLEIQGQVMQGYLQARGRPLAGRRREVSRRPNSSETIIPETIGQIVSPVEATPADAACRSILRPMIGQVVHDEPGHQVVAVRRLPLDYDRYAGDHTVGGRKLSSVDPSQHGLPIVPMTFTVEMMAEHAELVFPHLKVLRVENIQLMRWLAAHETRPHVLEITATALERRETDVEERVLVQVRDQGREGDATDKKWMAAIGTVVMAPQRPSPPLLEPMQLTNERPCRVDVSTTYNNLFHGDLFQGIVSLDRFGDEGIEGTIRALPRRDLFGGMTDPQFISDPVLLDVAMHPPCAWHLSQPDQSGRIVLPFEVKQVEFFGDPPPEGAEFLARTRVVESTPRHFTHVTEAYDQQGRLWARIDRVKLWRFYLPFSDVNFHGPKDVYIISDGWPEAVPSSWTAGARPRAWCMRFNPLDDLRQAALQSVGAKVTMSPKELERFNDLGLPTDQAAQWLFGRMAAKDAVRVLWQKHSGERLFMADVEIFGDAAQGWSVQPRQGERPVGFPSVAVAQVDQVTIALASIEPSVGVDVVKMSDVDERNWADRFSARELGLAPNFGAQERLARLWTAKRAAARAFGGATSLESSWQVCYLGRDGRALVEGPCVEGEAAETWLVDTTRADDFVVAAALGERGCEADLAKEPARTINAEG